MSNLMRFETRKLLRSKSFYILAIVSFAVSLLQNMFFSKMGELIWEHTLNEIVVGAINNSALGTLIAIFVSIFVCDDEASGFIKNVYAKGFSRTKVFLSKYFIGIIVSTIYVILNIAFSYIYGSITLGTTDINAEIWFNLLIQIIAFYANYSIYFFIAILVGKTGLVVAINIVGVQMMSMILSLGDLVIKTKPEPSNYWVTNIVARVATGSFSTGELVSLALVSVGYIVLVLVVGMILYKRKEI